MTRHDFDAGVKEGRRAATLESIQHTVDKIEKKMDTLNCTGHRAQVRAIWAIIFFVLLPALGAMALELVSLAKAIK